MKALHLYLHFGNYMIVTAKEMEMCISQRRELMIRYCELDG